MEVTSPPAQNDPKFRVGPQAPPPPPSKSLDALKSEASPSKAAPVSPLGDLRFNRPYFLVPLDPLPNGDPDRLVKDARKRIQAWMETQPTPVTDVFIISHGWHRNFYQAYAGYDRIMSRAAILLHRRRLQTDPDPPFNPLFLFAHWHSDPGANEFYDPAGRRKKPLFLQNAGALFEPLDPALGFFTTDFEEMYALLTELASPGTDALNNPVYASRSSKLYACLQNYRIKDSPTDLTPDEKVAVLWRCYNEAEPTGLLTDQNEETREVLPMRKAAGRLIGIGASLTAAAVGPFAMLGFLGKWLTPLSNWFSHQNGLLILAGLVGFYLLEWFYLVIAGKHRDQYLQTPEVRKNRGIPVLSFAAWVVLFVPPAVVVVCFCLVTYLFGERLKGVLLWNERQDPRKWKTEGELASEAGENEIPITPREKIIGIARWPNRLAMKASANDSLLYRLTSALDQQLAVAEMQRLGAETGGRLADFLVSLVGESGVKPNRTKIHLIGHSFGGMVICNAVRKMALHPAYALQFGGEETTPFSTVCTLQGAMSSAWFVPEETVQKRIRVLGAVYTRYDTATGYIYPFGFGGRLACGSVGWFLGDKLQAGVRSYGKNGTFATLVKPPHFDPPPEPIRAGTERYVLNLDASHIEFEGPPLSGGAHTDIYRDDVVNLLWGVVRLGRGDKDG